MGLFGGGYSKPGPGVSKEQAAKRNYFEILGRKFFKLIQINLLYALVTLPLWGLSVLLMVGQWDYLVAALESGQIFMFPYLPFLPWLLAGPFTAGLTYILRNFAKQEPCFLVSDFFEHTKKNWKQGLLASVVGTVVLYVFINGFFYYRTIVNINILLAISFVLALILISMSYYVYPMMVTFKMKFTHIIKNAWIFAIAKFPQNLFFTIIVFGVHFLLLWYLPIVWIILMPVILVAWSGYTENYYVWHVMKKYMIGEEEKKEEDTVFSDAVSERRSQQAVWNHEPQPPTMPYQPPADGAAAQEDAEQKKEDGE